MIVRFVIDLEAIEAELDKVENEDKQAVLEALQSLVDEGVRPDMEVLDAAMERLLIILHVHDLQVSAVASGVFQSISTGFSLELRHCVLLGEYASQSGYHALAVEWVKYAQELGKETSAQTQEGMEQLIQWVISKVRNKRLIYDWHF